MNQKIKKLNQNGKIAKIIGSDLPISLLLLSNKNTLPDSAISFLMGLSLLPNNVSFSYESLKAWFQNNHFEKIFKPVTIKGEKHKSAFDFYFKSFQSNFFSKPIIKKISNNLYKSTNILSKLRAVTPHHSLFKVMIDTNIIQAYKGDITKLIKDLSFNSLHTLVKKCNKSLFTNKLIESIFGLNKREVNKYLSLYTGKKVFQYRTIGYSEKYDLGLTNSVKKKQQKIIKGFCIRINFAHKLDFIFNMQINFKSLYTIKDRLEKHQIRYSSKNFFPLLASAKIPKLSDKDWSFNEQYELLGYTCTSNAIRNSNMKNYIETINLGQLTQQENIYSFLCDNYQNKFNMSFKEALNSLSSKFIY